MARMRRTILALAFAGAAAVLLRPARSDGRENARQASPAARDLPLPLRARRRAAVVAHFSRVTLPSCRVSPQAFAPISPMAVGARSSTLPSVPKRAAPVTSVKMGYNLQHPKIANDITHKLSKVFSIVSLYSKVLGY